MGLQAGKSLAGLSLLAQVTTECPDPEEAQGALPDILLQGPRRSDEADLLFVEHVGLEALHQVQPRVKTAGFGTKSLQDDKTVMGLEVRQDLPGHVPMDLGQHEDDVVGLQDINLAFLAKGLVNMVEQQIFILGCTQVPYILVLKDAFKDSVRRVRKDDLALPVGNSLPNQSCETMALVACEPSHPALLVLALVKCAQAVFDQRRIDFCSVFQVGADGGLGGPLLGEILEEVGGKVDARMPILSPSELHNLLTVVA